MAKRGAVTMTVLEKGLYRARLAEDERDLAALLDLRSRLFRNGSESDRDAFDARFRHLLIEPTAGGEVVAGLRFQVFSSWAETVGGYAAQFYDIERKFPLRGHLCEIGRLAVAPVVDGPDVLRLLLGALTRVSLAERVAVLFGCVSLPGSRPARHAAALRHLRAFRVSDSDWAIETIAPETVTIGPDLGVGGDAGLPPLLRSYLAMGARIGGRAVIDRDLDTIHVLTLLDVRDMPASRLATLKALAE